MPPTDLEKVRMYWDYQKTLLTSVFVWAIGAYLTIAVLLYQYSQSNLWWVVPFFAILFFVILLPGLLRQTQRRFRELSKEVDALLEKIEANATIPTLSELVKKSEFAKQVPFIPRGVGLPAVLVLILSAILVVLSFSPLSFPTLSFDLGFLGLSFSLAGALVLIRPRLKGSKKLIQAIQSGVTPEVHPDLKKAISSEVRYARVGLLFLTLGFLLQLVGRVLS